MKNPLSKNQRRIAAVAALAVAILLTIQGGNVGLEHTPWLIGVLVIAALLVLAIAPASSTSTAALVGNQPSAELVPAHAFAAALNVFEAEFMPVAEKTNANLVPSEITAAFVVHVRIQAVKLAWLTAAMVLEAKYAGFRKGHRFQGYGLLGGQELRKLIRQLPGIAGPEAGTKSLELAAKEIGYCTAALETAMQRTTERHPYPMNTIFELVEREFPYARATRPDVAETAQGLDAAYSGPFRRAVAAAERSAQ